MTEEERTLYEDALYSASWYQSRSALTESRGDYAQAEKYRIKAEIQMNIMEALKR